MIFSVEDDFADANLFSKSDIFCVKEQFDINSI